jgi:hypothetical protein
VNLYRVELRLSNATGLGPEWLPAAVAGSLQDASLASVESYDGVSAVVIVRAGARPAVGADVSLGAAGIALSIGATPSGTVVGVGDALDAALPPPTKNAALSILGAISLIAVVCYLVSRMP